MRNRVFIFITLCAGLTTQAQWYFETGVNDSKFAQFVNLTGTKTTLHSYNGLRDFSHAVGYVFPFKSLEKRAEVDAKTSLLRLGLGVGFDQMNLRTQAQSGNSEVPVHYNMSQVQGQLNLLFTPTIITKREPDAFDVLRPVMNLLLEGGLTYNLYTNAVRSYTTNKGYVKDLKNDDNEFVDAYPAFSFAGGLEFPLSRYTTLYGKYVVENAFSTDDNEVDQSKETYSTVKRRVMIGLRLDLNLRNKLKDEQEKRIAVLEAREEQPRDTVDLSELYAEIDALQKALDEHKHDKSEDQNYPVIIGRLFDVKKHDKGFMYLPDFKHVLFPINSSYFNESSYAQQLGDLTSFMQQNPHLTLKLVGYADSKTGTKENNLILSEKRARRVFNYLLKQGMPTHRMQYVGAGETLQFSIDELTENRRTEIIIVEQ